MFRALDCSAFMPSPPRAFSDSVGFTPVLAPLGTVYQRMALSPRHVGDREGWAHHRTRPDVAQDFATSQSLEPAHCHRLRTLLFQTYVCCDSVGCACLVVRSNDSPS